MSNKRIILAIDGPAGAGKSTIARRVAGRLGFVYINTGAMYRAVALWALRNGTALDDMHRLERLAQEAKIEFGPESDQIFLNGEDVTPFIYTPEVAAAASRVSTVPGVRRALIPLQRSVAEKSSVVMEGRDIGSVIFPEAQVKIFLDAKPEERARRRAAELREQIPAAHNEVGVDSVAAEIRERDIRDRSRSESPLVQAPDAHLLDTTELSVDEVEEEILRLVRTRTSNGKEVHR
jgi:cytidylate kinase